MYGTYIDYTKYYKLQKTILSGTSKKWQRQLFLYCVFWGRIYIKQSVNLLSSTPPSSTPPSSTPEIRPL